ncbi:MAG: polysaccharide biosynthesis/export family protein [Cytophagales bacterium]|nr:polysaccharide biosynthesis/export family protein [Cytophagales bacterium]
MYQYAYRIIVPFVLIFLVYCMPIRRQMYLKDAKRNTIKEHRTLDTTILLKEFSYRLKPGDYISVNFINIINNEYDFSKISTINNNQNQGSNLQNNIIVNDTGCVLIPVLGIVSVSGLTIKQAENLLQAKANTMLNNIIVRVRIENFVVYMLGEINKIGPLTSPKDKLTLMEAIAISGGFTEYGNRENLKIIRTEKEGLVHIYYINYSKLDILSTMQIYLLPNDIIIVEPHRVKNIKQYSLPNVTLVVSAISLILLLAANIRIFAN